MKINDRHRLILVGILRSRERIKALPWECDHLPYEKWGQYRVPISDAREGMVRPDLREWLGHFPSDSESVMCSRAYEQLSKAGLVTRWYNTGSKRVVRLSLTEEGEAMARRFLETVT